MEAIAPDAVLVVAYGRIVPQWMLELPRFGNINLHGSLLPKYRGAAPIQVGGGERRDCDRGDDDAAGRGAGYGRYAAGAGGSDWAGGDGGGGVCVAGSDGGEADGEDAAAPGGGEGVCSGAGSLAGDAGSDLEEGGWVDRFFKDGEGDSRSVEGFQPWPGAHTILGGKKLIVHKMRVTAGKECEAGVLRVEGDSLLVGCAGGAVLCLDEVQMEGKKRMGADEFLRGYQVRSGERLGL